MASSGDAVMVALVADNQACARFLAPDFIKQCWFRSARE
jgi:hypothetical protein